MSDLQKDRLVDQYLTELRAGDGRAMEKLYDCVYKPLFALCYGYFHNAHDSEDALQESFLSIKREIGKFNGTNGFNWVYTITKNICLKNIRRDSRSQSVDFTDSLSVDKYYRDESDSAPVAFDETGIIRLSQRVLKSSEYETLVLRAVYGLSFKEIAKMTNKIETTVRWQYHNAITKVRKEYERRYANNDK